MNRADGFKWSQDSDGEWLCIRTNKARAILESLDSGRKYDFEIKEHRERRSLDANAYAWVLIGKLSAATGVPPEDVYRGYIRDVGGNYSIVPVREDRLRQWERIWCSGHVGRMVVDIGECRSIPGYHNMMSYIGSSDYDTKQMTRLIDLVVTDCNELGIETMTPQELAALTERWGNG